MRKRNILVYESENRGFVPTIQPEPYLSCGFCEVLDNFELIMHIKFQKFNEWMQRYG